MLFMMKMDLTLMRLSLSLLYEKKSLIGIRWTKTKEILTLSVLDGKTHFPHYNGLKLNGHYLYL